MATQEHDLLVLRHSPASQTLETLVAKDAQGGLRLPAVAVQDPFYYGAAQLVEGIRDELGVSVAFVRCLAAPVGLSAAPSANLTIVEHLSGVPTADWQFVSLAALSRCVGLPRRQEIEQAVEWLLSPTEGRVPWSRLGWLASVIEWLPALLDPLGDSLCSPVRQERSWERSCVLSFDATAGRLFLKFVPVMFAHEPELAAYLSDSLPHHVPSVLASGKHPVLGHYLLMRENRGTSLSRIDEPRVWEHVVASYAQMQIWLAASYPDLSRTGLPRRDVVDVRRRAMALFSDRRLIQGYGCELTDDEVRRLSLLVPALTVAAEQLKQSKLPQTVDHGDLWSGQVLVSDQDCVFTDWSDAAWSHPFLGMPFFLDDAAEVLRQADRYDSLREVYVGAWSRSGDYGDLQEAFAAAELLGPLENALLYSERILPAMDLKWEMSPMLRHHLHFLLAVGRRRGLL